MDHAHSPMIELTGRSAAAVRTDLVASICREADADAGLFYAIGRDAAGRVRVLDNYRWTPDDAGLDRVMGMLCEGSPVNDNLADPSRCKLRETQGFYETQLVFGREEFRQRPLTRHIRAQTGLEDQIRLLAFQGARYLGWIGAFRAAGSQPFNARDRHRLAPMVARTVTTLAAAEAWERQNDGRGPAFIMVTSDGRIEHASDAALPWLDSPAFRTAAARIARAGHAGLEAFQTLERFAARVVRMSGHGESRILICLEPIAALERSPLADLTPTQTKVAQLAAVDMTREEIARELRLSKETVHTHLRAIYQRLGLADRGELIRLLARSE